MTEMTTSQKPGPDKPGLRRAAPLIGVLAVAVLGAVALGDYLNFETLRDNRAALETFRDANFALTVVAYMAIYVAVVAFSLPGATIATLAGGFLFGTLFGSLVTVTAATLGATLIFLAARHGLGETLARKMDAGQGKIARIKQGIDNNQWSMLFLIRLVPVVPFFVANLLPALVNVPVSRYMISTFLGIIPGSLVYTSVGAGLGEVFARNETPDLGIIFEPHVLLPMLGLAALALLPVILRPFTGKTGL